MSLLSEGPAQFTGTARYVNELLRTLEGRADQVRVHALVAGRDARRREPLGDSVSIHPVDGRTASGSRLGRVASLTGASLWPGRLAREFPPEVDVVHYPLTFDVPRVSGPTVVTFFDVQHHDRPDHFSRAEQLWRRVMYDRAARNATAVITISRHARARIVESGAVEPDRITAIHLGVDHERFTPEHRPEDEALLAPFALPSRFLFYPASLWPHKNHLRLLDAVAALEDDELALVLCGATFGRLDALMAQASRRGLGSRVRHLGEVPDDALPALYRRATALVFPSLHEGFGMPPLEAMACGCPVASSRAAALDEVCGTAVASLDPLDPAGMARTLADVVAEAPLRERLRREGLVRAAQFSWERAGAAHVDVYRRAVEQHRG